MRSILWLAEEIMNQESFEMSSAARLRLDGYLDQIERLLMASGVDRVERRSILDDVEAQALEMLQERSLRAEEADVEMVLARLDAPEDYARIAVERAESTGGEGSQATEPAATPPMPSAESARLSPYALAGAIMLLPILVFGPMAFGLGMLFIGPRAGLFALPLLGRWSLLAPLLFLILMCVFGTLAINQIRFSEGRFYGMGLAVAEALALPLLLFDAAILTFLRSRFFFLPWSAWQAGPIPWERIGLLLVIVALDGLIVWWVWNRVNQPPSTAPSGGQLWQSNINIP